MEEVLEDMPITVNREMNEELDRPLNEEKITTALSQMCSNKASGLNGFLTALFQKH